MTKTILVPIDVSAENGGTPVIAVALDLAKAFDGKIVLLNVVPLFPGYTENFLPDDFYKQAAADAEDSLKQLAIKLGIADTADIVVRIGTPAGEILTHATEVKADIIVIGSHDPELADYVLGSVAARVVRHAHCSVMVVR